MQFIVKNKRFVENFDLSPIFSLKFQTKFGSGWITLIVDNNVDNNKEANYLLDRRLIYKNGFITVLQ